MKRSSRTLKNARSLSPTSTRRRRRTFMKCIRQRRSSRQEVYFIQQQFPCIPGIFPHDDEEETPQPVLD